MSQGRRRVGYIYFANRFAVSYTSLHGKGDGICLQSGEPYGSLPFHCNKKKHTNLHSPMSHPCKISGDFVVYSL